MCKRNPDWPRVFRKMASYALPTEPGQEDLGKTYKRSPLIVFEIMDVIAIVFKPSQTQGGVNLTVETDCTLARHLPVCKEGIAAMADPYNANAMPTSKTAPSNAADAAMSRSTIPPYNRRYPRPETSRKGRRC